MECHHCGEKFDDKKSFNSHLTYHLNVQKGLRRPRDRSYGARYVSAKKKTAAQGPATSPEKKTEASGGLISKDNADPHDATSLAKAGSTASASESGTVVVAMDARSVPRKANWDMRSPEAVRGLQKVLDKYPIFPSTPEGPQLDTQLSTASDASCKHCSAIFSHIEDLKTHYLSKDCNGVAAIVHLMLYDSSKVGNYRLEMRLIPFDHKTDELEFQCRKCEICFETEEEADEHEQTHPNENKTCPHCRKAFSTTYELEEHYEFHDDMAFRHKRDSIRAGEPIDDEEEAEARRFLEQPGIERFLLESAGVERIPRKDGDLIAIGFISSEDLERVHAPYGVFKEKSEYYYRIPQHLDPDNEPGSVSIRYGETCVTEGRMVRFGPSRKPTTDVSTENAVVADVRKSSQAAENAAEKPSRFRRMLGLRNKNEKSQSSSADDELYRRRASTSKELAPSVLQETAFDANAPKRQSSASHTTSKESRSPNSSEDVPRREPYGVSISSHGVPGRMFIRDKSDRILAVSGTLFGGCLYPCIIDSASAASARSEAVQLLNHASASSSRGDLGSAARAWGSALSILQSHDTLDPNGMFRLVVLWELAKCLDSMHASLEAEVLFYRFLDFSYAQSGRESINNYKAINSLGVLYDNLGRPQEAAEMYARSIGGRAKLLGPRHYDTAMSLQELGTVYLRMEEYAGACPLFEASLAGLVQEGEGPHRNLTLMVMHNLCTVYGNLNMLEQLLPLLDTLVQRAPVTFGLGHLMTGAAIRKWLQYNRNGRNDDELPADIKGFVAEYREMYTQTESEVARWVLEVC